MFNATRRSMSSRIPFTLGALLLILIATPSLVVAQGDYPCEKQADCAAYGDGSNDISANSQCVADPASPQFGYCGYAGATCSVSADCDYGRCESGVCRGYLGDSCSGPFDCLAYLQCGTDGKCGGTAAECVNGGADCISNSCTETTDSKGNTSGKCTAPPSSGMPNGQACGNNGVCSSGFCSSSYTCSAKVTASQRARSRRATVQNARQFAAMSFMERASLCPRGMTACLVGRGSSGFECINPMIDLESCGGCVHDVDSDGYASGTDCTSLPNTDSVLCNRGKCQILSCLPGYSVDPEGKGCF